MHRNATQLEQPADGVLDQVVRTGSPGRNAHGDLSLGQPIRRLNFLLLGQAEMADNLSDTIMAAFLMK